MKQYNVELRWSNMTVCVYQLIEESITDVFTKLGKLTPPEEPPTDIAGLHIEVKITGHPLV